MGKERIIKHYRTLLTSKRMKEAHNNCPSYLSMDDKVEENLEEFRERLLDK